MEGTQANRVTSMTLWCRRAHVLRLGPARGLSPMAGLVTLVGGLAARRGWLAVVVVGMVLGGGVIADGGESRGCLLYTSPSPRDGTSSRMPSSA